MPRARAFTAHGSLARILAGSRANVSGLPRIEVGVGRERSSVSGVLIGAHDEAARREKFIRRRAGIGIGIWRATAA